MIKVFCGQNVQFHECINFDGNVESAEVVLFPESGYGTEGVRKLVHNYIDNYDENLDENGVVFITRYDTILNELGCAISDKKLKHDVVEIYLYDDGKWSTYGFTEEGFVSKDWPFGILS